MRGRGVLVLSVAAIAAAYALVQITRTAQAVAEACNDPFDDEADWLGFGDVPFVASGCGDRVAMIPTATPPETVTGSPTWQPGRPDPITDYRPFHAGRHSQ